MSTRTLPSRQRGVTLVELVLFIVIIGVATSAILGVMSLATSHSADPQLRKQALAVAEGMLEEITLARITYCDPTDPIAETATSSAGCTNPEGLGQEAGGVPRPYDNVSDYGSASGAAVEYSTDAAGAPFSATGGALKALVKITAASLNGLPAGEALHIEVRVPYGHKQEIVLDGYRTRYAPNNIP